MQREDAPVLKLAAPAAVLALLVTAGSADAIPLLYDPAPGFASSPGESTSMSPKVRAAIALLEKGDPARATIEARAALKEAPGSAVAHEVIGAAAMLQRDWTAAERSLAEAVRLSPRRASAWVRLGQTLLPLNELKRAADAFAKALAIAPGLGVAQRNLALIHLRQGQVRQAVTLLQDGLKASAGRDRETSYLLASIYHEAHRPAETERLLTEILTTAPDWTPALLLQGIVKLEQGKLDTALPLIEHVTRRDPHSLWGRLALGVAHRVKGQPAASLPLLEEVTRERPDWALAQFQLGETLMAQREVERAMQAYARAEAASAEPSITKLRVADTLIAAGQADLALAKTDEVMKLGKARARARIVRAQAHLRKNSPADAERELKKAITDAPADDTLHLALAAFYRGQRAASSEEATLARYAERFAASANGPAQLGRFYLRQRRYTQAVEAFKKAIAREPNAADAQAGLAEAHSMLGHHPPAIEIAERVVTLLGGAPAGYVLLSSVQERAGQGAAALESYRRAVERGAGSLPLDVGFAELHERQGKRQEALRLLDTAARAHPRTVLPVLSRAQLYDRTGDEARAAAAYREVLQRDARHPVALNNLAWLLGKHHRNIREGLGLAERAYELAPGPLTADTLGWLHYRAGDLARASARLRESVARDADNPSVQYRLGVVLAKLGKTDEALQALDRALRSAAGFQEAPDAKRLLVALSTKESRPTSR